LLLGCSDERLSPLAGDEPADAGVPPTDGPVDPPPDAPPPTKKRDVLYTNPFGNVAETQNLLWDGDFEWLSPFTDQYGWIELPGSPTITDVEVGPACRSGLKCARLEHDGGSVIGIAVSSATLDLEASIWARFEPVDGVPVPACAEVDAYLADLTGVRGLVPADRDLAGAQQQDLPLRREQVRRADAARRLRGETDRRDPDHPAAAEPLDERERTRACTGRCARDALARRRRAQPGPRRIPPLQVTLSRLRGGFAGAIRSVMRIKLLVCAFVFAMGCTETKQAPATAASDGAARGASNGAKDDGAKGAGAAAGAKVEVGKPVPDFKLKDTEGKEVSLASFKGKTVVLEWFNPECPFVKKAHGKGSLAGLASKVGEKGVVWLSVNSGAPGKQGAGVEKSKEGASALGVKNPILIDESGEVGKTYGATNTPHMFVIDPSGVLVYAGAIDNSPDAEGESPEGGTLVNYVTEAISAIDEKRPVKVASTKAYGCSVKY
jgi:peroxiredoxin